MLSKQLAARGLRQHAAAGLRCMSVDARSMSGAAANRDTTVYGQGAASTFTVEHKARCTMRDLGEKVAIPAVHKFSPPPRLLCGPGPGNAHPRVHAAMSLPQVGHLDPYFMELMEDIKALLRYTYQTNNEFTVPVSGTGSAAMEACVANMVEPGDKILVGVNGYFGHRMINMAQRYGGVPIAINKPWGEVFTYEEIKAAIEKHQPKIVGLIHAETSTGACQPFDGVGELCRKNGAILIADCVTSISGVPLYIDEWGIDASYAGTQKALSCPPGVSPLTFGPRAMEKLMSRKTEVANWYLDMKMVASYIGGSTGGGPRSYHHTAPISMCYAMREALELVREEVSDILYLSHVFLVCVVEAKGVRRARRQPPTVCKVERRWDGLVGLIAAAGRAPVRSRALTCSHACVRVSLCVCVDRDQTLPVRWARHRDVAETFWQELENMGLEPLVAYEHRLPTLTTIKVPPGVDAKKAVSYILEKYQIEIGNGLGDLAGKCGRIGAWAVACG